MFTPKSVPKSLLHCLKAALVLTMLLTGCGSSVSNSTFTSTNNSTAQTPTSTNTPVIPVGTRVVAGPLVQMSNGDPLTSQADLPGDGTAFLNSQVEDHIVVNPQQPLNIIASVQQDRWGSGAARAPVAGVSYDGGATFATIPLPGTTTATGGPFHRFADPWVAISNTGRAFFASLLGDFGTRTSAITVSTSDDGGTTWSSPTLLSQDGGNDKEAITADFADPNSVYIVWQKAQPGNELGDIFFSRTTNGGTSWEPERKIAGFPPPQGSIGNQILSLSNGRLVNLFALQTPGNQGADADAVVPLASPRDGGKNIASLGEMHSDDHGVTWSTPQTPLQMLARSTLTSTAKGVIDPGDGTNVRSPGFLPAIAVNRLNGEIYNVWQDTRFSAPNGVSPIDVDPSQLIDEIAFSVSRDNGVTWSTPVKINKTPTGIPFLFRQAFLPQVAVSPDGTVVVTYYDFRNDNPAVGCGTDVWAVYHKPNAGPITDPNTWQGDLRLTDATFNLRLAPNSKTTISEVPDEATSGYFLGDYVAIASAPGGAISCFSQPLGSAPAACVIRRIFTAVP